MIWNDWTQPGTPGQPADKDRPSWRDHGTMCATLVALSLATVGVCITGCGGARLPASDPCPPAGYDRDALLTLRDAGFELADPASRSEFALGILACLADPDPVLRDQVAYEALGMLLRNGQLDAATIRILRTKLLALLREPPGDEDGFLRPFAALALAEVARTDRMTPVFTPTERGELVSAACEFLRSVTDYRGFDDEAGWRHGVAHGADLLMQLVLNPRVDRAQVDAIRDAISSQIAPPGEHFYVFGEPGRLARPILFMASRQAYSDEEWARWFEALASPAPLPGWQAVWSSRSGLARLHNTRAFAEALYVRARLSGNPVYRPVAEGAEHMLGVLP